MNLKHNSKSGFTLIELLVVMLILVILAIGVLPALKEYTTRARYTADVDPAIGNIRTKVELYRYDHDHLPGMALEPSSSKLKTDEDTNEYSDQVIESFRPDDENFIHTMSYNEADSDKSGLYCYLPQNWTGNRGVKDLDTDGALVEGKDVEDKQGLSWHAFKQAKIGFADLRGKVVAPDNFQYAVIYNKGDDYCWVVGAMGNGGGLGIGTGYAVLEYSNTKLKTKFVATFERYTAESTEKPLTFAIADFSGSGFDDIGYTVGDSSTSKDALDKYIVIDTCRTSFPKKNDNREISELQGDLDSFKKSLKFAGWSLD